MSASDRPVTLPFRAAGANGWGSGTVEVPADLPKLGKPNPAAGKVRATVWVLFQRRQQHPCLLNVERTQTHPNAH